MNAEKLIGLYLAPHFLAISLLLAFIAARCGFASSFALSYEIAPVCSQSLIVLISSVCLIISSLIFLFSCALTLRADRVVFKDFHAFFVEFCHFFLHFFEFSVFLVFGGQRHKSFFIQFRAVKTELKTL